LVRALRAALAATLEVGSWKQIKDDHQKVGLPWRADLEPGNGKWKYVARVLEELPDAEVIAVARSPHNEAMRTLRLLRKPSSSDFCQTSQRYSSSVGWTL
jgi:hypothetical protein